jgi:hypothetical protein
VQLSEGSHAPFCLPHCPHYLEKGRERRKVGGGGREGGNSRVRKRKEKRRDKNEGRDGMSE